MMGTSVQIEVPFFFGGIIESPRSYSTGEKETFPRLFKSVQVQGPRNPEE